MAKLKTLAGRVPTQAATLKTLNPDSWRATKQSSTQRGYGYKWQQARLAFLDANPLCCYCQAQGLVVAATVVDHKVPHRGNQELFWDRSNWQPLCSTCHSAVKQREEAQGMG